METADILATTAEVSIGLAGFGGIVAGLGYRTRGEWSPDDRTRLLVMARISLIVVFASLLPQVLSYFTTPVWRLSSALYLVPATYNLAHQAWINRRGVPEGYSWSIALLMGLIQLSIVVLLAVASSGFAPHDSEGVYVLALLLMLLGAALLFSRLLATSFRERPPAA